MSYHTKLYRPLERTQEEARELALAYLSKRIERQESADNLVAFPVERLRKVFGDNYENVLVKLLNYHKRWLRRIESNLPIWNAAVWLFQPERPTYVRERKTWYLDCSDDTPSLVNPFRFYGSETTLWSLEETIAFINSKADSPSLHLFPDTYDQLEEFWKMYPNGMIEIG